MYFAQMEQKLFQTANSNSDVQVLVTFPSADKDRATKFSVDLEQQTRLLLKIV